jgi:hypothetical protein
MLDLVPRRDLARLSDTELAERLDAALDAYEALQRRWGLFFYFQLLSWTPRTVVEDPHEYICPKHVQCEIRDIKDEMERRLAGRRPQPVIPK